MWAAMVGAIFESAKTGFEIALGLTGVMSLWLGLMKIGENGGVVEAIARAFGPLFRRLFPGIPTGHPAGGAIVMNLSANVLGLDNAATPLGLKAMKELQTLNPRARPRHRRHDPVHGDQRLVGHGRCRSRSSPSARSSAPPTRPTCSCRS